MEGSRENESLLFVLKLIFIYMIKLKSLLEISDEQKEMKKDYFLRVNQSHSNTIPSFNEIWNILKKSDGFKHLVDDFKGDLERGDSENKMSELIRFYRNLKFDQKERYDEILHQYKRLNGQYCWRVIRLPINVKPEELPQLGVFWSVSENKAEAHWGRFGPKYPIQVTYKGIIDLKNIDWQSTIRSRMDMSMGDDEEEIRFIPHSKIFVESVYVEPFDKTIYIRKFRRV